MVFHLPLGGIRFPMFFYYMGITSFLSSFAQQEGDGIQPSPLLTLSWPGRRHLVAGGDPYRLYPVILAVLFGASLLTSLTCITIMCYNFATYK